MSLPVIDTVTPGDGPLAGGTETVIAGLFFTGATDVTFCGSAASFVVDSDEQITATSPPTPGGAGLCDIVITTPAGSTQTDSEDAFEYLAEEDPPPDPIDLADGCIAIEVPTLLCDGATPDGNGIVYTVEAVDGWHDSIPMRSGLLEAQPRGETIVVAHEGGRTIDVRITAHTTGGLPLGAPACFAAMETIKAAFRAVFVPVAFRVVDAYADRTLLARRVGPIKQSILGDAAAVTFSIPMLGEDPRRFAT